MSGLSGFFEADKCDLCGECMAACPRLEVSGDRAREIFRTIIERDLDSPLLGKCISCFACNQACPKGLDVHAAVMELWESRRPRIPWHVKVALPEQRAPNVWHRIQKSYSKSERALLSRLRDDIRGKDVLYLGCNQLLDPYIADSSLLAGLPVAAAAGVCCGEPYFRMGFLENFRMAAQKWTRHWEAAAPGRMVMFCPACLNMTQNVYPAYLGEKPKFAIVGMYQWLAERIGSGALKMERPLDKKVAVQDSCHARVLGEPFLGQVRSLIEAAGLSGEMGPLAYGTSPCCGFAGAAPGFNPLTMLRLGMQRIVEMRRSAADEALVYCNGCLLMLTVTSMVTPAGLSVRHLIEFLEAASGREKERPHKRRGLMIMGAALATAGSRMVRPGSNVLEQEMGGEP